MAGESTTHRKSIGFFGLLTLLFVGLKLGEVGVVANWSWWLVLAPLWGPWAIFATVMGVIIVLASIGAAVEDR